MLEQCGAELSFNTNPPLSQEEILLFVGWMLDKNLSGQTISSYLAALRQLYLTKGIDPSAIRTGIVDQIIKGRNRQMLTENSVGSQQTRLPVTPEVLKLMKHDLKTSDFNSGSKLLIWAVASLAFSGAMRINELLAGNQSKFNPLDTLLSEDICVNQFKVNGTPVKFIQLKLKQDKTNSSTAPRILDIFEAPGPICPVRAWEKYSKCIRSSDKKLPAFRKQNGGAFTARELNRYLHDFTKRNFPNTKGKFTCHSFRIGLASTLANRGIEDEEIQLAGRWSSRAFESYLRLPRVQRAATAQKIAELMK